ncbi:MAG TPA: indole-3-glycerol phosphate synthase TrpC [Solirubrobacteraceae bacterium]|nr:indole-3-glycerol phosphate synthase TrpC [Solirubrobacteraceae bacterium]
MKEHASSVLDRIVSETRQEVELRKRRQLDPRPPAPPAPPRSSFRAALLSRPIGVIAEFKRRSPSAGELRASADLAEIVAAYQAGGAVALSVLTEGPNFGGSLGDLLLARSASDLPLLCKDFIVDPYQLFEARAYGADAVLLIVAALEPATLESLYWQADELGLDVLVEVHDERETELALAAGAEIIGINNRDLRDFTVDVARTGRLLGLIPPEVLVVSESGIAEPTQLSRLHAGGVRAVLVGETLMRAGDPAAALRALREFSGAAGSL